MRALWKRLVYKLKRNSKETIVLPRRLEPAPHIDDEDGVVRVCRMDADGVMKEVPRIQPHPQPVIPAGFMNPGPVPPDFGSIDLDFSDSVR